MKEDEMIGERVVVHGMGFVAIVSQVEVRRETDETILHLDWGAHGTSRVRLHDRGTVWQFYREVN